ncbi:hypothetical protein LDO26_06290 [Luteimonas sp. BDR2-5]|nr:hypothetical protein [Luteimonas sp. BDR2-5]
MIPESGTGEGERHGQRKLPHRTHVIYYKQPSENALLIVRILHATIDVDSGVGA